MTTSGIRLVADGAWSNLPRGLDTLIVAGGTQVTLVNGASARNVFWQVGSSATIGTSAAYAGNIIAYTSITLDTDATLLGRALASNGQVSMQSNKVTVP